MQLWLEHPIKTQLTPMDIEAMQAISTMYARNVPTPMPYYPQSPYGMSGLGINPTGGHFCPQAATDNRDVLTQTIEVPAGSPGVIGTWGDPPGWWCGCPPDFPNMKRDGYYGWLCLKDCGPGYQPDANHKCQAVAPSGSGSNAVAGPAPTVFAYGPPPTSPASSGGAQSNPPSAPQQPPPAQPGVMPMNLTPMPAAPPQSSGSSAPPTSNNTMLYLALAAGALFLLSKGGH